MGKYDMGNNPLTDEQFLILSTGALANMTANTVGEASENADNLLTMIVVENYEKIVMERDRTVKIIDDEVRQLVDQMEPDYKKVLIHFLTALALSRLGFNGNQFL